MTASEQRVMMAAMIQAAPKLVQSCILRHWAKEEREYAPLYEKLIGPEGRARAEADALRHDAEADEAEKEAIREGERAARIAAIIETWKGGST